MSRIQRTQGTPEVVAVDRASGSGAAAIAQQTQRRHGVRLRSTIALTARVVTQPLLGGAGDRARGAQALAVGPVRPVGWPIARGIP